MIKHTVQSCVHPTDIHQQTDHGHGDGRWNVLGELFLQNLAAFAALRHGIDIYLGKGVTFGSIRILCEDSLLVLEDETQKIILDVFPPQRYPVFLLQVTYLVSRIDRRHAPVCIASRRLRCRGVDGSVWVLWRFLMTSVLLDAGVSVGWSI